MTLVTMKRDQIITLPQPLRESALSKITVKDLLFSGMASLGLHALAIFLVIVAGNLFSAPATLEKSSGLKVSLVTFSAIAPSPAQQPGIQDKGLRPASPEREKGKIPERKREKEKRPPEHLQEKQLPKIQAQGKREMLLIPAPGAVGESVADKEGGKGTVSAGTDPQTGRQETARYAPAAEPRGAAKANGASSRDQTAGQTAGHAMGGKDITGEYGDRLRSAVSRYRQTSPPVYPQAARQKGYEGLVLISVEILENGSPGQLLVKKSSGYEILDQAALSAVRKWKFVPASKNSVHIRTWGDVPIRFVLQDSH